MKDFKVIDHGTKQVDLRMYKNALQLVPTELHYKPSLVIVLTHPYAPVVYGQISLEMFNEGLEEIGYEIKKIWLKPKEPRELPATDNIHGSLGKATRKGPRLSVLDVRWSEGRLAEAKALNIPSVEKFSLKDQIVKL